MGIIYSMIGLIVGTVLSLIAVTGVALGALVGGSSRLMETMMGIGAIILFPILYGLLGVVSGLLTGAIYNLAVRITGGIEVEGVQTNV